MKNNVITNLLLAAIVVLLLMNLFTKLSISRVEAETFKMDDCITAKPGDKPAGYVHVIIEN